MKTQLLLTAVLLFATFTTFAQHTIDGSLGEEIIKFPDITDLALNSATAISWTTNNDSFRQLRDYGGGTTLNGDLSFALQTNSGSVTASLTIDHRVLYGNSGTLKITIDGYTVENSNIVASSTGVDVTDFEQLSYTFTQPITISTTPINVKVEYVDILKDLTIPPASPEDRTGIRVYDLKVNVTATLSTNDIDDQTGGTIVAYPNPVTNSFQLDSNTDIENVKLYNITGRLLKTYNAEANYDISDLATGIYIANINTRSGSKTLRIVKE